MTQIAINPGADIRSVVRTSWVRPWIALAAAAVVFALGLLGVVAFMLVLPVIGVGLALGAPPDHVTHTRSIARRPRNAVLGVVLAAALAVVILRPELSLPLVTLFGLDGSGLAASVLAVVALALPLAMMDAPTETRPDGFLQGFGQAERSGPDVIRRRRSSSVRSPSRSRPGDHELSEAGRLQLDAAVQRYLPWWGVADPEAST